MRVLTVPVPWMPVGDVALGRGSIRQLLCLGLAFCSKCFFMI